MGNLVASSDTGRQAFYDCDNRLVQWKEGSKDIRYRYDPDGRRILKQDLGSSFATVLYFWDGWQTVEETTSAGVLTKQFVWGEGIDECVKANLPDAADIDGDSNTGEKVDLYYHHNSLGSVVAVTDLNGVVKESYTYTAFGQPTIFDKNGSQVGETQVEQPFMWTGARFDFEEGSGLYQMRLRFYDPASGRFVSRDPLGLWGDASQSGNGQSYCGHNPVNRVDPLGDWSPTFEIGPTASDGQGGAGSSGASGDGRDRFTEEDWAARDKRANEMAKAAGMGVLGVIAASNPYTAGVYIVVFVFGAQVENCQDPDLEAAVLEATLVKALGPTRTRTRTSSAVDDVAGGIDDAAGAPQQPSSPPPRPPAPPPAEAPPPLNLEGVPPGTKVRVDPRRLRSGRRGLSERRYKDVKDMTPEERALAEEKYPRHVDQHGTMGDGTHRTRLDIQDEKPTITVEVRPTSDPPPSPGTTRPIGELPFHD